MTEELFATDAYRRSFDAAVVATDRDAGRVALGRTAFYPGGGGQPHDLGTLDWGDGPVAVTRVKREEGRIWHWLDAPELPGEGVEMPASWTGLGATCSCAPTRRCTCCAA
jgi:misacylated tRNA(Ala) deacylase